MGKAKSPTSSDLGTPSSSTHGGSAGGDPPYVRRAAARNAVYYYMDESDSDDESLAGSASRARGESDDEWAGGDDAGDDSEDSFEPEEEDDAVTHSVEAPPPPPPPPLLDLCKDGFWAGDAEEFASESDDEVEADRPDKYDEWKETSRQTAIHHPTAIVQARREVWKRFYPEPGEPGDGPDSQPRWYHGTITDTRVLPGVGQVWKITYDDGDWEEVTLEGLMDALQPPGLRFVGKRIANPHTIPGVKPITSRGEFKRIWRNITGLSLEGGGGAAIAGGGHGSSTSARCTPRK